MLPLAHRRMLFIVNRTRAHQCTLNALQNPLPASVPPSHSQTGVICDLTPLLSFRCSIDAGLPPC